MPPPFPLTPTSSDSDPFCTQKFCDYEDIVPTLTSIERQSIGTSSDWTYQSISATPLSSTSFPLIPTSAQGDPFCTDSFCQDNSGTEDDVIYYTSRYQYVRFRAVWTVSVQGVIQTWPLRNNPGIPVYYSSWYATQGTKSIFLLDTPYCDTLPFLPCRARGSDRPYPFSYAPWLLNYTGRFGFNGGVSSQNSLPVYRLNSDGFLLSSHGGTAAYSNFGDIGDFWASVAGVFEFTNGPLINVPGYPDVSSQSEIVSWEGLPVPSDWTSL